VSSTSRVFEVNVLYLKCKECDEVFDDLDIARAHMDEENLLVSFMEIDHPGFDILTEEEAM
jgi:hypothetical protein